MTELSVLNCPVHSLPSSRTCTPGDLGENVDPQNELERCDEDLTIQPREKSFIIPFSGSGLVLVGKSGEKSI